MIGLRLLRDQSERPAGAVGRVSDSWFQLRCDLRIMRWSLGAVPRSAQSLLVFLSPSPLPLSTARALSNK